MFAAGRFSAKSRGASRRGRHGNGPARAAVEPLEGRVLMASQLYEAETARLFNLGVAAGRAGYTGSGYVDYDHASGDYVEWAVAVDTPGSYALDVRYAHGGSGDRPLEMRVDGAVVGDPMSFAPSGGWDAWTTSSRTLNLPAGTHLVRLTAIGASGPNVDSLTVRLVEPKPQPTPPAEPITLQAEAAAFGGGRLALARSGYTGTGYVDFSNLSGDFVAWAVSVKAAGKYNLGVRYANGSTIARPVELRVNGAAAGAVPFAPTGGWSNWSTVEVPVTLAAGANEVSIVANGSGGPNVDALVVPAAPVPAPGQEIRSLRVYHIGNSLTNGINYAALDAIAEGDGREYVFGRHVISGAPLSWIYDRPDAGNRQSPFGRYYDAFTQNEWDVLTLQPFDRQLYQPDGGGDVQVAQKFIDLATAKSPHLQTYVYQRWPRRTKLADGTYAPYDYEKLWLRTYTGKWDRTNETRDYFNQVVTELRKAYPDAGKPVLMVPVGDVMFELNRRIIAGQVPGVASIDELFWDGIHLTNWGGMVLGTTFYATMYQRDPRGLTFQRYDVLDDPWDRTIDPGFAAAVQQVVWDVVKGHPFSGV